MGNGDMQQEQRYAVCSFAHIHQPGASSVREDIRAGGTHVGSASAPNCLGPGGSEDNGQNICSLWLLRFCVS